MNREQTRLPITLIGIVCLLIAPLSGSAEETKTVVGPTNPPLADGAQALLAGDAEEGVRLTLIGLRHEPNRRDRLTGMSNLCAGYIMLEQLDEALTYCTRVLDENPKFWRALSNRALAYVQLERYEEAEADLQLAEEIAPNARTVRIVRSMLRDAVDPVAPSIVIDDRREPEGDED